MRAYLIGATVTLAFACNAVLGLDQVEHDPGSGGSGGGGDGKTGDSNGGSGASVSHGGSASGVTGGSATTSGAGGNDPGRGGSATTNGGNGTDNSGGVGEGGEGASPGTGGTTGGTTTGVGGSTTTEGGSSDGGSTGGTNKGGASNGGGSTNGGTSGTGGSTSGGKGGTTGTGGTTGGNNTGGSNKGGSTGVGGSTTSGGKGGSTSTGGTSGGATSGGATSGGATSGGMTGTGGIPTNVATALNGRMLLAPCLQNTDVDVCSIKSGACPGANASDPALSGALISDQTITLGGSVGQTYTIMLHIQGVVEAKDYSGGTDTVAETSISTTMNGFHVGGTPVNGNAYGVWLIRVTSPKNDYFLNDLINGGGQAVSNHTTYRIDYQASIQADGGTTVRLVASDLNCSMIKNCGDTFVTAQCASPEVVVNPDPMAVSKNSSFDFTTPYNGNWISIVVTSVTLSGGGG